jgi:hypothetical protein
MGTLAFAIAHGGYTIFCLVMTIIDLFFGDYRFEAAYSTISDDVFFWIYIAVNTVAILIPVSKLIWIFVE